MQKWQLWNNEHALYTSSNYSMKYKLLCICGFEITLHTLKRRLPRSILFQFIFISVHQMRVYIVVHLINSDAIPIHVCQQSSYRVYMRVSKKIHQ